MHFTRVCTGTLLRNETTHGQFIQEPKRLPYPKIYRESQEWRATAEGLNPYSQHRFRVRAVNDVGAGEWSTAGNWARTEGGPSSAADHDSVETDVTVSGNSLCQGSSGFEVKVLATFLPIALVIGPHHISVANRGALL